MCRRRAQSTGAAPVNTRTDHLREAMEGAIPAVIATCSADGEPNIAFLSQVHYVDETHVALSYQFFNKTRRNLLANPIGHLTLVHPHTGQIYRLRLRYQCTERSGALFERMKAHLEGIASHTGMAGVFRLRGSDICAVEQVDVLPGNTLPVPTRGPNLLPALRRSSEAIAGCPDFASLVDCCLDVLAREFGLEHAMVLLPDESGAHLYMVGSRGYAASGVGAEIPMGDGVIGVCAQARTPIRISWMTQAYRYSSTIRNVVLHHGDGRELSVEIPYPGLADPSSQLGVPMLHAGRLFGVLFVESDQEVRFTYDHEDALVALANQVAASIHALRDATDGPADSDAPLPDQGDASARRTAPLRVRRYAGSNSIFVDDTYVIKGVAGAILWRLLQDFAANGRTEFSNREIRLDSSIGLPDVVDNLEARLILLRRRLAEQALGIDLEKCGRGRLRLIVMAPLHLSEIRAE